MSRSLWAVVLAAIFSISSWLGNHGESHPFGGDFVATVPPTLGGKLPSTENFSPDAGVSEKLTASQLFWRSAGTTGWTQSKPEGLLQPISATTNSTVSVKLRDLPVGKTIKVGEHTFVKISDAQWLAGEKMRCTDPALTSKGALKNFDYTGSVQSYTAYAGCEYKLEVWGASGGYSYSTTYYGGYGGYSVGNVTYSVNTTLYVVIGGIGGNGTSYGAIAGGYNGGGTGGSSGYFGAGGGGTTHIATVTGLLSQLSSNTNAVLIVAGGGGSGGYYAGNGSAGGNGGGIEGVRGSGGGYGGTQTTAGSGTGEGYAGSFGKGGNLSGGAGSGGGGGWYGGGSGDDRGGGGGSGYIASSNLISSNGITKHMTCYSCTTSTAANTYTISNTCVNATATADCAKTGNGYARITRLN